MSVTQQVLVAVCAAGRTARAKAQLELAERLAWTGVHYRAVNRRLVLLRGVPCDTLKQIVTGPLTDGEVSHLHLPECCSLSKVHRDVRPC